MTLVRPKKYLGQHFLKSMDVARRIAGSLPVGSPASVLEIGPGMGMLTQFLLQQPQIDLKVVEIDHESVVYLQQHYPQLQILEEDFLQLDLNQIFFHPFSIIGNFPYNISSQIFFKVLDNKDLIPSVVGMLQKEVAERLASPPGNKAYGILSVLLQANYDINYLFTVDETVFFPPPKVKSAVISLKRKEYPEVDYDEQLFRRVVKTAFNQRRKTLRNSLKSIIPSHPMYAEPLFDLRPEQLDVKTFVELTNKIGSALKEKQ